MTDIAWTRIHTKQRGVKKFKWALGASENGVPVQIGRNTDVTAQVYGTFGGAVTLFWSDDVRADPTHSDHANAKWVAAHHAADGTTAFSKTADGGEQIFEAGCWFQPRAAAGVSAVTFYLQGVK